MNLDRLEQIKERLSAATPGPWGWSGCANDRVDVCSRAPGWEAAGIAVVTVDYEFNNRDELVDGMPVMDRAMAHSNGALIMHAPEDLRELVAEVEMLRGVGCGELREGAEVSDGPCGVCLKCARKERDEARAEVEELNQLVTTSDRQLGDEIIGLRRELSEALRRMKTAQNERDFANERLRRLKAETGWAKRECGCQCQWEEGDSPCPVHGEEAK